MGKNIAAGVAGTLIAVGLVWLIEMAGHLVYPPPPDIDFSDKESLRAYAAGLPIGAFGFIGGAWFLGTLGGVLAACKVGTAEPKVFAMIIGGLILLATAVNLVMIPHPLWFSMSGVAGIIVAAWLGMSLSQRSADS
jgi:hypothetical protein